MPLNDERPTSTSSGEDQGSDLDSTSEHLDSRTSTSDLESSRHSFTSDGGSSKNSTPSSSPPKPITLDEVMASAKELSNLSLAHEIIVNRSFHLQTNQLPQNSLEKLVRDAVHKAFWDILESELNGDPPQYEYAIKQLEDIRETLLSFLNPGANRMRTQIMEVLDMDLIRQQADNDALDIQGLASYVVTTMGKMCAPARDDEVRKLREITDTVTQFKEIFRVLDLMKLDMVNFTIENMRPELQKQSVEYERAKFQSIVDKIPGALDHTTSWIRSAVEELVETMNKATNQTNGQGKGQKALPGPFLVIDTAFLHVLTWDHSKPLPETLMTDEARLREIQWQLQQLQAVDQVLLIVYSAIGGPIQGLSSLAERLKRMTSALLDGMHRPDFNLEEALEGASTQICCELNKSLTERNYPSLTPALQASLSGQICSLTQRDNPIRTLVEERVQQYFMGLITAANPKAKLEQVPTGLTAIQPELASLGAKFIGLVNYNKRVYGPFYSGILRKLMFSDTSPTPSAAQEDPAPPSHVVSISK